MHTIKMAITPQQAQQWLDEKNIGNRNLAESRVNMYLADMNAGNWHLTHQGIAFYEDGLLADGQTRLKAITMHGKPIEMLVTFGLARPAGVAVDANRPRREVDQIKIAQMSDWVGKDDAAITKVLRRIGGGSHAGDAMSSSQIVAMCEQHKAAIQFAAGCFGSHVRYVTVAPVRAAIACAHGSVDTDRLSRFCAVLCSGLMESMADSAAVRLRERLIACHAELNGSNARPTVVRLTMRAIKAFCSHEQMTRLSEPKDFVFTVLKESE